MANCKISVLGCYAAAVGYLCRYIVDRGDQELWDKVLSDENTFRRQLIDQVGGAPGCAGGLVGAACGVAGMPVFDWQGASVLSTGQGAVGAA